MHRKMKKLIFEKISRKVHFCCPLAICTLAKRRDGAGSGTETGTSFPFKTSKGKMPSALEAIPTGLIKELVIANFIWRCIDRACTERFETVGIKGNTTPRGNQEHTHAPKPEEPIARSVVESMKSAARETTRHISEIYEALRVPARQLHPGIAGSLLPISTLSSFCSGQGERLILYGVSGDHTLEFLKNFGRLLHF